MSLDLKYKVYKLFIRYIKQWQKQIQIYKFRRLQVFNNKYKQNKN